MWCHWRVAWWYWCWHWAWRWAPLTSFQRHAIEGGRRWLEWGGRYVLVMGWSDLGCTVVLIKILPYSGATAQQSMSSLVRETSHLWLYSSLSPCLQPTPGETACGVLVQSLGDARVHNADYSLRLRRRSVWTNWSFLWHWQGDHHSLSLRTTGRWPEVHVVPDHIHI